jgi:N-acetylneuraminic acid mutarotase
MKENNKKFYLYGGVIAINRDINIYSNDLWSYDTNLNIFEKLNYKYKETKHSPGVRGGHSIICDSEKDKLYIFAGKNENERFNDLFEYDLGIY